MLPDAEGVAITWLTSRPPVAAAGITVADTLGAERPFCVVSRAGGVPVIPTHLDRARLDVDLYAPNRIDALDAARLIHAELHLCKGRVGDAWVTGVRDDAGLIPLPDPDTGEPHWRFSVLLYAHRSKQA